MCVEQADGDGLDSGLREPNRQGSGFVLVERLDHGAVGGHSLGDLEAVAPRDERRRLRPEVVVEVRHPHPPQLEHVAEALGRHEREVRSTPLEHGVRRDGRPVHHGTDRMAGRELADRRDDRAVVGRRRREHLGVGDAAVLANADHVGERAADVGTDACPLQRRQSRHLRSL